MSWHIAAHKLPEPQREYRFHRTRRWRFDFAWPDKKIAVEVEGITRYGKNANGSIRLGRHQTAKGFKGDCEKYNAAIFEGWRVLRYPQDVVVSGEAILQIKSVLEAA